jgi:hypothetical protein
LKKENRKARKMLAEYQLMMRTGASGMHKVSMGCLWIKMSMVKTIDQHKIIPLVSILSKSVCKQ